MLPAESTTKSWPARVRRTRATYRSNGSRSAISVSDSGRALPSSSTRTTPRYGDIGSPASDHVRYALISTVSPETGGSGSTNKRRDAHGHAFASARSLPRPSPSPTISKRALRTRGIITLLHRLPTRGSCGGPSAGGWRVRARSLWGKSRSAGSAFRKFAKEFASGSGKLARGLQNLHRGFDSRRRVWCGFSDGQDIGPVLWDVGL